MSSNLTYNYIARVLVGTNDIKLFDFRFGPLTECDKGIMTDINSSSNADFQRNNP